MKVSNILLRTKLCRMTYKSATENSVTFIKVRNHRSNNQDENRDEYSFDDDQRDDEIRDDEIVVTNSDLDYLSLASSECREDRQKLRNKKYTRRSGVLRYAKSYRSSSSVESDSDESSYGSFTDDPSNLGSNRSPELRCDVEDEESCHQGIDFKGLTILMSHQKQRQQQQQNEYFSLPFFKCGKSQWEDTDKHQEVCMVPSNLSSISSKSSNSISSDESY